MLEIILVENLVIPEGITIHIKNFTTRVFIPEYPRNLFMSNNTMLLSITITRIDAVLIFLFR